MGVVLFISRPDPNAGRFGRVLISDLKRINSHICSIAYPILDSAGALAPNRLRSPALPGES